MTGFPNAGPNVPVNIQQLLQPPQIRQASPLINPGDLIVFNYLYWQHDPKPLVIVADTQPGYGLRGVNINYLTFNTIKRLLRLHCNQSHFSYQTLKGNRYIQEGIRAFRTYKWNGVTQIKKLDCDFILRVMGMVRSFDPSDVESIKNQVREQIKRQVNPTANQLQEAPVAPAGQPGPFQG